MGLNLSKDAQRILGAYLQLADLSPKQEDALQRVAGGDQEACLQDLTPLLDGHCLRQAQALIRCDPNDDQPIFETAIVGRPKVIKENIVVRQPRRGNVNAGRRDPYYAKIEIDPRASVVALVSGSKFEPDADRPRPRMMKLVARTEGQDGAPTDADWDNLEKTLAKANMDKLAWNPKGDVPLRDLDIRWIGSKTASIETKDIDEPEFDFGSSIVAISHRPDGVELSRTNALDPINIQRTLTFQAVGRSSTPDFNRPIGQPREDAADDSTPPETHDNKLAIELSAKDLPRGTWHDTPNVGEHLGLQLRVGSRWLMEAGTSGSVKLLGATAETHVQDDDVYFNGSHATRVDVPVKATYSIANVLQQKAAKVFGRVDSDTSKERINVRDLVYQRHGDLTLFGKKLDLIDATYARGAIPGVEATKRPIKDAERDALAIDIELGPELLAREDGSLEGFTIDVGYWATNAEGQREWCAAKHHKGAGLYAVPAGGLEGAKFTVNFDDFPAASEAGQPLEVIVRDDGNFPLGRVSVPLTAVDWA